MRRLLVVLALALAVPAAAEGGTYTVSACSGGATRLFTPAGSATDCSGGALGARIDPVAAPWSRSGWALTAPPGTSVRAYSADYFVDWAAGANGQYGSFVSHSGGYALSEPCTWIGCTWILPATGYGSTGWVAVSRSQMSVSGLSLDAFCGNAWCNGGFVRALWRDLRVTFLDESAPAVTGVVPSAWVAGTVDLAWSASDNSGIRRARLEVDGAVRHDDARPCDYGRLVPCSGASGRFSLDTRDLSDGPHAVDLVAVDATDSNAGRAGATLRVDNTAPVVRPQGHGNGTDPLPGPVTVTLSATDSGSGIDAVAWSLDGGPLHESPGQVAEAELDGDGVHTLAYSARDRAGNVSADTTVRVRIGTPVDGDLGARTGFRARSLNPRTTFSAAASFR